MENRTVFYITREGQIRMAELIKPAFVIRTPNGRVSVSYRVYNSEAEAQQALTENGGKLVRNLESTTGSIHPIAEFYDELKLLKLKVAVLDETKIGKPRFWIALTRFFKGE